MRAGVSTALAFAMVVTPLSSALAQSSASTVNAGVDGPRSCAVADERAFRSKLVALTDEALRAGLARVDFKQAVADQWRENRMDALVDGLVDEQTEVVKDETDWDQLLASLISREKLESLTQQLATRVYRSDAFRDATADLATDAARAVSGDIELATLDAAGPAVQCVRAYLGARFGRTIGRIVADDTQLTFEPSDNAGRATVGAAETVLAGREALAGIMVLVARRMLARITARIGQRVAGAVVSRVVSTVVGGLGVLLILKDAWDLRNGFLPTIAEEMKSDESKSSVRDELASVLEEQTFAQLDLVSNEIADRIIEVWREFQTANAKVVELAGELPEFKRFLDRVGRADLPRVDRVVGIILRSEGRDGVLQRLADGSLARAATRLSPVGIEVADEAGSLGDAFAWERIADGRLDLVLRNGLHRAFSPQAITPRAINKLLDVEDGLALGRLRTLTPAALEALTEFPADELRGLARRLDADELGQFAGYLTALSTQARERLLELTGGDPRRIQKLTPAYVRNAVVASKDQSAAVSMLLRDGPMLDWRAIEGDVRAVFDGEVSPVLLWPAHPAVVVAAGLLVVILLLMLNRIFGGGRRRREQAQA